MMYLQFYALEFGLILSPGQTERTQFQTPNLPGTPPAPPGLLTGLGVRDLDKMGGARQVTDAAHPSRPGNP